MSHNTSQYVARWLCLILAGGLVACGGGSERSQPPATTTQEAPAAPTTLPAPAIDLSLPIPGGSLHGTPRPKLENTGDDYVAITKSLLANFRWLTENPVPSLLAEIFVPGTPPHDERVKPYEFLASNGYRWADEGYRVASAELVDAQGDAASLRVVEELAFERLVDSSGTQIGELRRRDGAIELSILIVRDANGRWRVADASRKEEPVVEL